MKPVLLIADSDIELCELYAMFFAERGFETETACDGLDCVNKLGRHRASVLLLDRGLCWDGADGGLAWLREQTPVPELSVVLTTGPNNPRAVPSYARPPVGACLTKPFRPDLLFDTVRTAVIERRWKELLVPAHAAASGASLI
jgi:DNA-binding NtrC family response regulator